MSDIVQELYGLAIGMAAPSLARDTVTRGAKEIERLQDAKRRALAIADERAKEAVVLRAALEAINGEIVLTGQLKDIVDAALEQREPTLEEVAQSKVRSGEWPP